MVVCSALKAKYRAKLRGTGALGLVSNNIILRELFGVQASNSPWNVLQDLPSSLQIFCLSGALLQQHRLWTGGVPMLLSGASHSSTLHDMVTTTCHVAHYAGAAGPSC